MRQSPLTSQPNIANNSQASQERRAEGESNNLRQSTNDNGSQDKNNLAPITSDVAGASSADEQTFYAYDSSFDNRLMNASQ